MKRNILLTTIILTFLAPISAKAFDKQLEENASSNSVVIEDEALQTVTYNDYELLEETDDSGKLIAYTVSKFKGTDKIVSVPAEYNGVKITQIGSNAFKNNSTITTVNLTDNILVIGDYAFYNCTKLKEVNIPTKLEVIGEGAFGLSTNMYCDISLPQTLTSLGESAFYGCGINSLSIPNSIKKIPKNCFAGHSLATIEIPSSVEVIDESAFSIIYKAASGATGTRTACVKSITLNEGLKEIGSYAFYGTGTVSEIVIPKTVTKIDSFAFYGCMALEKVDIKSTILRNVGAFAFYNCINLKNLTIAGGDDCYIGDVAFRNCVSLENVKLGEGITRIGNGPFMDDIALKEVYLPKSLKAFDDDTAFLQCTNDFVIYYPSSPKNWGNIEYSNTITQPVKFVLTKDNVKAIPSSKRYTGEEIKAAISVDGYKLEEGKDITVNYADNIKPGTATVAIAGCGDFTGEVDLTFTIGKKLRSIKANPKRKVIIAGKKTKIIVTGASGKKVYSVSNSKLAKVSSKGVVTALKTGTVKITVTLGETDYYEKATAVATIKIKPKQTRLISVTSPKKGRIKLNWKENTTTDYYQIQCSTSKGFKKSKTVSKLVKKNSIKAATIKHLKEGKLYYVRIRSVNNKKKLVSPWSKSLSVSVK